MTFRWNRSNSPSTGRRRRRRACARFPRSSLRRGFKFAELLLLQVRIFLGVRQADPVIARAREQRSVVAHALGLGLEPILGFGRVEGDGIYAPGVRRRD
jgi:hypothetical protein